MYLSWNKTKKNNFVTANEGSSVGLAIGYYLAKKKLPLVYLQNSGLGNTINPLVSMANEKVFQSFISDSPKKTLWHGHSFTANPLGCAAANASLDLLQNDPLKYLSFENKHLLHLERIKKFSFIRNVRVSGTIAAFDIRIGDNYGYLNNIGKDMFSWWY